MNIYCDSRCSCPARLFLLGLLGVLVGVRLRRPHLRAAFGPLQVAEQWAPRCGLSCLATISMNNPG